MIDTALANSLLLLLPLVYSSYVSPGPATEGSIEWSYNNTKNWGLETPQCNGERQSPIHLRRSTIYILPIPPIKFGNYDLPLAGNLTLNNNGHSIEFDVPVTINTQRPFISGGIMRNKFEAVGVHFHWGSKKSKGSEHVIDNRRFDVEMHVVHKNVKYGTLAEAIQYKDGLAVFGIMFKIVNEPDRYYPGLNKIFNQLPNIKNYQNSINLEGPLTLGQLLGDLNTKQFFTYSGSVTTPNCAEAVIWHVFPEPLPIAQEQIAKFWSIRDTKGNLLNNNYRPVQYRNKRPVFYRVTAS